MILYCSFEELTAARSAAGRALGDDNDTQRTVAAPPIAIADLEALAPRLTGDVSIATLGEQISIQRALLFLLDEARSALDESILTLHPGDELAVQAYFDYAHLLTLADRVRRVGQEMALLIEVVTGAPPTEELARTFSFPD